jgi:sugar lactone lactonase YvrE
MIDPTGAMTTIAGTGERATSGDDGPATQASINGPNAIAVDGDNIYIAEQLGDRIRVINRNGIITTFAGDGKREPIQEGTPAVASSLAQPAGLAIYNGEVYFTEFAGNYVRKVSRDGKVYTLAGTGQRRSDGDGGLPTKASLAGPVGIAVDRSGNIYVSEVFGAVVRRFKESGVITSVVGPAPPSASKIGGVPARSAHPRWPAGLAVDDRGTLYFADFAANRIYAVDRGRIRNVAGTGAGGFAAEGKAVSSPVESPFGLALDSAGNLYTALYNRGSVLRMKPGGDISQVIGEAPRAPVEPMPATQAFFKSIGGVAADARGNVYFSDVFGNTIRKVSASDGRMTLAAGTGMASSSSAITPARDASFHYPVGVEPLGGGFFVAEAEGHRIRWVDAQGTVQTILGTGEPGFSGDLGAARLATCAHPHSIFAVGEDRINPVPFLPADRKFMILFTDTENNRVRKIDVKGVVSTVAGNGSEVSSGDGGPATRAGIYRPEDVVADAEGNIYISERGRVRKVDTRGIITTVAGNGERGFSGAGGPGTQARLDPYGLAADGRDLYIADSWNNVVWKLDEGGIINVVVGTGEKSSRGDGGSATQATLNAPIYPAIQRLGDRTNLLVSELEGGRVRSVRIR